MLVRASLRAIKLPPFCSLYMLEQFEKHVSFKKLDTIFLEARFSAPQIWEQNA